MNDKHFDDFLRQQLQGANEYLSDGDFTQKVMAGLPAPRRLSRWMEVLIVVMPVTLIALLVLSQFPLREFIQPVYALVLTADTLDLISLGGAALITMLTAPLVLIFKQRSFL